MVCVTAGATSSLGSKESTTGWKASREKQSKQKAIASFVCTIGRPIPQLTSHHCIGFHLREVAIQCITIEGCEIHSIEASLLPEKCLRKPAKREVQVSEIGISRGLH